MSCMLFVVVAYQILRAFMTVSTHDTNCQDFCRHIVDPLGRDAHDLVQELERRHWHWAKSSHTYIYTHIIIHNYIYIYYMSQKLALASRV